MRRPAEPRRAQAAVEWLAVIAAVAAVGATAAAWHGGDAPARVARLLAAAPSESRFDDTALAAALAAQPGALTPLGAEAWLIEERGGEAAQAELARAASALLARRLPGWDEQIRISGRPRGGRTPLAAVATHGPPEARVVSFDDEAALSAPPTARDRTTAAATALGWSAVGALAQRIARPLGVAVGAVRLLLGQRPDPPGLPPGGRAGDVLVCRAAVLTATSPLRPAPPTRTDVWRVAVLRDGRVIRDAVTPVSPCRAPAGG